MIHANDRIAAIDRHIAFVLEQESEPLENAEELFNRVCDHVLYSFVSKEELTTRDAIEKWVNLISDRFRSGIADQILKRAIALGQIIDNGDGTLSDPK